MAGHIQYVFRADAISVLEGKSVALIANSAPAILAVNPARSDSVMIRPRHSGIGSGADVVHVVIFMR